MRRRQVGALQRIDPDLPEGPVKAGRADDRIALRELFKLWERAEGAVAVDDERSLVTSDCKLDLVAPGLWKLDHAQTVSGDRPLRFPAADGGRAVRGHGFALDRLCEGRQIALTFLNEQGPVLESNEASGGALDVGSVHCNDSLVLTLARNAVDSGLGDDPREQRSRGALHEAALLGEPLMERLAPEQSHYPEGSMRP
jgi:hypothetical protein